MMGIYDLNWTLLNCDAIWCASALGMHLLRLSQPHGVSVCPAASVWRKPVRTFRIGSAARCAWRGRPVSSDWCRQCYNIETTRDLHYRKLGKQERCDAACIAPVYDLLPSEVHHNHDHPKLFVPPKPHDHLGCALWGRF